MNTILGFVCERKYTGIVIVAVTIIIVLILTPLSTDLRD